MASTLQHKVELFAAELARGDLRRSSLNEFLELIRDASAQFVVNLGRAAERVQSFKQVARDQSRSQRRTFNAAELTDQVLSHLARELRERDIALDLHSESDLSMDSYPGPFGQALTNLALNSMAHAFPDDRKGTITVRLRQAGSDHVEVLFVDDGCGMPADVKRRAFDPFFTTRRHEGASGLGLHIVHSIVVDRLGGRIRLDSEAGVGTTVQLVLPRLAPA